LPSEHGQHFTVIQGRRLLLNLLQQLLVKRLRLVAKVLESRLRVDPGPAPAVRVERISEVFRYTAL
jgi:hypothetical protein